MHVCPNAVQYGHLHIIEYAIKNGCAWDKQTLNRAAKCGQVNCLKFAIDNGCHT